MRNSVSDRHEGHHVQLWVSDGLYALLKACARRNDTPVAAESRTNRPPPKPNALSATGP